MTHRQYRLNERGQHLDMPAFERVVADPELRDGQFLSAMTLRQVLLATRAIRSIGEDPNYDDRGRAGIALIGDFAVTPLIDGEPAPYRGDPVENSDWRVAMRVDVANPDGFFAAIEQLQADTTH